MLGLDTTSLSLEEGELLSCDPAVPPSGIRTMFPAAGMPVSALACSQDGALLGVGLPDGWVRRLNPSSHLVEAHCGWRSSLQLQSADRSLAGFTAAFTAWCG